MTRLKILHILIIILLVNFSFFETSYAQKLLKHFNNENGLLSSEAYQVLQDHNGYIWIATDEGVSRYDGYDFQHYNSQNGLPESTVLELYEDTKDRLWFVMITNELAYIENDSLYIYPYNDTIQSRNFKNYYPIKESFYVDTSDNVFIGIYHKDVYRITSKGEIRKLNDHYDRENYVTRIDEKSLFTARKNKDKSVSLINPYFTDSIYSFSTNNYACRTSFELHDGKYYYSDYNKLVVFDKNGGVNYFEFEHDILWISTDKHNNLWFGFHHGGAVVYEDSTFTTKKYHLLPTHSISSVFEDNEGSIWISTIYNGVYMYSPLSFCNFGVNEGVVDLPITQIAALKNSLFFAGTGSYLYKYNDGAISKQNLKLDGQAIMCKHLSAIGDSLFIGHTKNGNRVIFDNHIIKPVISNYATAVSPFNSGFIFFHAREIFFLKHGVVKEKLVSKMFSDVTDVVALNDSLVWFATNNGLMAYSTSREYPYEVALDPMLRSTMSSILLTKDSIIWIASNEYGIININKNKVKNYIPEILNNKTISCLYDLDSLLITGTNDGIIIFRKDRDSLITENAFKINSSNGMQSDDVHDLEFFKGNIYVANSKGVSHVPVDLKYSASPIYFTSFVVNGNDTLVQDSYELEYNENYIDIEFLALNYQSNNEIKYYYMLEGVDRDWRVTSERIAQYSALSPGEYTFKLKAINSFGIQNETPTTISIIIKTAYYNTLWFRAVAVLAVLLIVFGIFLIVLRVRLREAGKRHLVEQELNRSRQQALSAQMNPHFIYNSLNSVQSYILKNEKVMASEYLSKLGRLMRNILNNSQNQVITLREEFEALEKYMEMEQLRFKELFTYRFNICNSIDLDLISVPPLIIQPFVENAIHHGLRLRKEDGELLVDACIKDEALQIVVQDNGVGIKNAKLHNSKTRKNHKSFGTEITHKRLQLLEEMSNEKVTLSVTEAYPENEMYPGTKVVLLINLS